jgi:hypothetical protein
MKSNNNRGRKGISPVISHLILLIGVLSAGMFLWWFTLSRSVTASQTFSEEIGGEIEKIEERFVIEHILIEGSEPDLQVTVWIYNYGKIRINATTVYMEHTRKVIPSGQLIEKDELQSITVKSTFPPDYVQVESERGTVVIGYP